MDKKVKRYEAGKRKIEAQNLPPTKREKALKRLARKLGF